MPRNFKIDARAARLAALRLRLRKSPPPRRAPASQTTTPNKKSLPWQRLQETVPRRAPASQTTAPRRTVREHTTAPNAAPARR
eukprot:6157730-Lingulodinium_polyedra.AAC.1